MAKTYHVNPVIRFSNRLLGTFLRLGIGSKNWYLLPEESVPVLKQYIAQEPITHAYFDRRLSRNCRSIVYCDLTIPEMWV
jgi:hypothetical protein